MLDVMASKMCFQDAILVRRGRAQIMNSSHQSSEENLGNAILRENLKIPMQKN